MALQTYPTTIGAAAAAVPIYTYRAAGFAAPGSAGMLIANTGSSNPMSIGPAGVTAATGIPIAPGATMPLPTADSTIYAYSALGTTAVVGVFT